ncbi:MAG TPA: GxxExxY protein [Terriglobales bacterium]|nr:GxxExxY protein [Terriglobales bacterium]
MEQGARRALSAADLSHEIIKAALKVHSVLGPGLLESAYEACLLYELQRAGFRVASQVPLPLIYESVKLDLGYRIDLLVEDTVLVELKAIEEIAPVHKAQLLSYLRLSKKSLRLLINFNVTHLKDGIHRILNGDDWRKPS